MHGQTDENTVFPSCTQGNKSEKSLAAEKKSEGFTSLEFNVFGF
jgi:hypothetical protein